MLVTPNLSEIQENVGPGSYKCRIVDAKFDEWQGKEGRPNTPYINWRMETFGEEDAKNNGRAIFHKTPTAGKGAFRLRDFYKAAIKQELSGDFDTEMLFGRELLVTVVDGTDKEGNPSGYTEVKAVRPI